VSLLRGVGDCGERGFTLVGFLINRSVCIPHSHSVNTFYCPTFSFFILLRDYFLVPL